MYPLSVAIIMVLCGICFRRGGGGGGGGGGRGRRNRWNQESGNIGSSGKVSMGHERGGDRFRSLLLTLCLMLT